MPSISVKIAEWKQKQERTKHTARGLAQVLWAWLQGNGSSQDEVDAGLVLLAQVEFGRVEACDRGASTYALDTPFGAFELHATQEAPLVQPLAIVFGALCAEREAELDRCAAWSLRDELRRPRDVAWFTPTLVDLVLAHVAGRDTSPLLGTADRILPETYRIFAAFVASKRRALLAEDVRRLGPLWSFGVRALLKSARLSEDARTSYVARRDALDRDPDALVQRLNGFAFAEGEVVASAMLAESHALGHDAGHRRGVASAGLRAFLATSEEPVPTLLLPALAGLSWSDAQGLLLSHPLASERLDGLFAQLAPPTPKEASELLAAPAVPRRAALRAFVALERWAEVLARATLEDAHARAAAHLGSGAPREALRALARSDDAEAQRLRRLALGALGESTLATSGAWVARRHPNEPERAVEELAALEPEATASARAAALRPSIATEAWVRTVAAAGAVAHAGELARQLRLEAILSIATDATMPQPELLWVALDKALAPTPLRHPCAVSPARELEGVLTALHLAFSGLARERIAAQASGIVDRSLRATLDTWLERHPTSSHTTTNQAATSPVANEPPAPLLSTTARGTIRRKRPS